jgi:hypothetical protein
MSSTRYIAAGVITLGGLLYLWPKASPGVPGAPIAGIKTTGVQNIENAYRRGGATSTHTIAYGGTVQGQASDAPMREGGSTGKPKPYDQEGIGEDQRPSSKMAPEKALNKTMYGNEKGK